MALEHIYAQLPLIFPTTKCGTWLTIYLKSKYCTHRLTISKNFWKGKYRRKYSYIIQNNGGLEIFKILKGGQGNLYQPILYVLHINIFSEFVSKRSFRWEIFHWFIIIRAIKKRKIQFIILFLVLTEIRYIQFKLYNEAKINLHPKKPLFADKPEGWADFRT